MCLVISIVIKSQGFIWFPLCSWNFVPVRLFTDSASEKESNKNVSYLTDTEPSVIHFILLNPHNNNTGEVLLALVYISKTNKQEGPEALVSC